jgi:hypothetical protein
MNTDHNSRIALEVEIPEPLFRAITVYVDRHKVDFNQVFERAITLWLNSRNLESVIASLERL